MKHASETPMLTDASSIIQLIFGVLAVISSVGLQSLPLCIIGCICIFLGLAGVIAISVPRKRKGKTVADFKSRI